MLAEDGITVRGIYERSDAKVRLKEGMERVKGFLSTPFDTKVEISENGVRYLVDVEEGQKTGYFLDQKYNRRAIQPLCRGKRVLDCFTHTGAFALNAAVAGGAREVVGVDASETGVRQAEEKRPAQRRGGPGEVPVPGTCSTCCPSWTGRGSGSTWSFWTRRPSPSPGIR